MKRCHDDNEVTGRTIDFCDIRRYIVNGDLSVGIVLSAGIISCIHFAMPQYDT